MIQKIKTAMFALVMAFSFAAAPLALTTGTAAAAGCSNIATSVGEGSVAAGGGQGCSASSNGGTQKIKTAAASIVNVFSIIVGIVAVIMIIYGGFRYITSGGDSGKVGNAKNSLVYAVVGLIVVALAQVIVQFVLSQTTEFTFLVNSNPFV